MLEDLTIKEWMLIYFVAIAGLNVALICIAVSVKNTLKTLMHESELVQYLKALRREQG